MFQNGDTQPESPAIQTRLFYGTDRNVNDIDKPASFYGLKRGNLNYGLAELTVAQPKGKARLDTVTPSSRTDFITELRDAVGAAPKPVAMVFTHGYNRSFHQSAKLAARFSALAGFEGVTILWSWPSSRNPAGYLEDEANMRWSHPHFAQFLRDVIEQSGAQVVHLVGHSMGARGLTDVLLQDLLPGGIDRSKIGEYVLLAPDIDSEIFIRDLAPKIVEAKLHTSIYTSTNDTAMASAYGLRRYTRLGDSSKGPVIIPGIDIIDASSANKSLLGHSYFEESTDVSADLAVLLNERKRAAKRKNLKEVKKPGGSFWLLQVTQ